jgi:LuxR family maltose regulon positive regulatory protein
MAETLLTTKLHIPPIPSRVVRRERLIDQLNESAGSKLILVSAPAGFGKTTLVSMWARQVSVPVTWLSLGEEDNDLARFLAYVIAACQRVYPDIGKDAQAILQTPQPISYESILASLLNDLAACGHPLLLILDDYHMIQAGMIHKAVIFLLDHLPAKIRLLLASRADPPLSLALLRARGHLTEVRQSDLRFRAGEAAAFLKDVIGLDLSAEDVAALEARTEGWIAGLQMAAVSLQGQDPQRTARSEFIRAFTGSHRFVLDYLVEEVLEQQPPALQEFLLQTSILERLCGPLCDSLLATWETGKSLDFTLRLNLKGWEEGALGQDALTNLPTQQSTNSQAILEHLEAANLFIVPLDDERCWYRYHRLFSDLLRRRLGHLHPELVPVLHRKAARWFERGGWTTEAVEHALAAGDDTHAADLIEGVAESVLQRGEIATLDKWVAQLPPQLVASRPRLDLYQVVTQVISGYSQETVGPGLERLARQAALSGETRVLGAYRALFQARFALAEELAVRGCAELPEDAHFLRSTGQWIVSICQVNVNDLRRRAEILEDLAWKTRTIDNRFLKVGTLCQLAEVRMDQGRLPAARDLFEQASEAAVGPDGRPQAIAGQALIGLGQILREWNQLEEARRYVLNGIERIRSWSPYGAMEGYLVLAACCLAQGDQPGVDQALGEARRMAEAFDVTRIDDRIVDMVSARIKLHRGDSGPVRRYFAGYRDGFEPVPQKEIQPGVEPSPEQIDFRLQKYEDILGARALLAEDQPGKALAWLDPLLPFLEANDRVMLLVDVELLRALALQAMGEQARAAKPFERALALAEPGGLVRRFLDEGRPVAGLLRDALRRGVCQNYASRLLADLEGELPPEDAPPELMSEPPALLEPLSQRELEVLRYLTSSLTVPEIAQQLFVAESTVRSHVKSIYRKLDVHRRVEAIERAQALRLIP